MKFLLAFAVLTHCLFICLDAPSILGAEGKDKKGTSLKKERLPEVVVTASRVETPTSEVPASVTVIKSEDLKALGARPVSEALKKKVEGVDVVETAGFLNPTQWVSLRGMSWSQNRTAILLDGVPLNNPNSGVVKWNSISATSLDRMEVVRGPFSSLYGSSAMGGVINLITRKPTKPFGVEFSSAAGEWETFSESFSLETKKGRLGFLTDVSYLNSAGYNAAPRHLRTPFDKDRDTEQQRYMGKLFFDVTGNSSVSLGLRYSHWDYGLGRKFFFMSGENLTPTLNFERKGERIGILATLYAANEKEKITLDTSPFNFKNSVTNIDNEWYGGNLTLSASLTSWNRIVGGVETKLGWAKSVDDFKRKVRRRQGEGSQNLYGIYLEDQLRLAEGRLVFSLGGRYEWVTNFDGLSLDTDISASPTNHKSKSWSNFSPRGGVVFQATDNTLLRASIGQGFRVPTLFELYKTTRVSRTRISEANPQLGPETSTTYEIGAEHWFLPSLMGKVSFYYTEMEDFIFSVTKGKVGSDTISQGQNAGKVIIKGAEPALKYDINNNWALFGSFTYNESRFKDVPLNRVLEGNFLPYSPWQKWNLGASYKNPAVIDADVTGHFIGRQYGNDLNTQPVHNYFVADLKLSRQVNEHAGLFLNVENLLDKHYQAVKDFNAPGFFVMGGIDLKF
ncbi:MAG TPA: TonB-dependent receptor plug domain-containing protein [Candidatus Tripitaka californicus]|uniref:TonB-dependent receptor plug domain-containing protein n=3 Tax=Candidatus Tripitaka californicus TaxID=3367616 RepID=UPI0040270690|nr:TonB-dependent receptor [Planctomycetota bacterium]